MEFVKSFQILKVSRRGPSDRCSCTDLSLYIILTFFFPQAQFCLVVQSCPTLCVPMDCSTPGLPVYHQLPEFAQTHVHWVSDAIQSFHPLSSPSPPAFNLSQHQGLFQWVSSSYQEAKVSEIQLQHHAFQWTFRTDFLEDWLVESLCRSRDSQESSLTHSSKASILRCSAFLMVQHPYMSTGKTVALTRWTLVGRVMSLLFFFNINLIF